MFTNQNIQELYVLGVVHSLNFAVYACFITYRYTIRKILNVYFLFLLQAENLLLDQSFNIKIAGKRGGVCCCYGKSLYLSQVLCFVFLWLLLKEPSIMAE